MKDYYITDRDTWFAHVNTFCPELGSHYIELPSGDILVAVHFARKDEANRLRWQDHPKVKTLPSIQLEGDVELDDDDTEKVKHLLPNPELRGRAQLAPGQQKLKTNIRDVARAAGSNHPLMRVGKRF
jgi:hypothetical protein